MNTANAIDIPELLEEFARIKRRFLGMDICAVKYTTVVKAEQAIRQMVAKVEEFDLESWLLEPSRNKPLAAAFAVNATKGAE